jgi:hypothetical protein
MTKSWIHSIAGLNKLDSVEQLGYWRTLFPPALLNRYHVNSETFTDNEGRPLLVWVGPAGANSVEVSLRHQHDAPDPLVYFHLTDTIAQQIHVLLVVLNDPDSPRFDVDRMPDGRKTHFGSVDRNLEAEVAAMNAGLAPGQVRRGLGNFRLAIGCFESFVQMLGHDIYFVEPLAYHNAVIFERYGFAYQQGRRWMQSLNTRFSAGGDLILRLDGSTLFRQPQFARTVRGRSWAIHDNILGEPYTGVIMYKRVGQEASESTFTGEAW